MPRGLISVVVAAIAAFSMSSQGVSANTLQTAAQELPPGEDALVTRIVDGDTIEVRVNDTRFTVHYIGIDAPDTKGTPAKTCLSKQATAANRALVLGKTVRLERDVSEFDASGRLLRYAYLPDGTMVNDALVRTGFALAIASAPDVKHGAQLAEAMRTASNNYAGLWSKCPALATSAAALVAPAPAVAAPAAAAPAAQPQAPAPAPVAQAQSGCEPAYPTLCIPLGSPDLDCGDISQRQFEVHPPDPHRFDRDHDGIGCES